MRRAGTARVRRLLGLAAVGAVIVGTGVVTGAGSAVGDQKDTTTWSYACAFPSGSETVSAQVTALLPDSATPGSEIQPTNVTVTVTIPDAAVASLTSLSATTTTATAALTVAVAQNSATTATSWPDLVAPATTLPATGSLALAFAGTVPVATAADTGDLTFTAGALNLEFTPATADGSATTPATVSVNCTLGGGQHALLATVPVPAPALGGAPPSPGDAAPIIGGTPKGGAQAPNAVRADDDSTPPMDPNCPIFLPVPPEEADVVGKVNLNKIGESSDLATTDDPGMASLAIVGSGTTTQGDFLLCWSAVMTLPPIKTTVLTFGFEPTTATMTTTQIGPSFVENWQHDGVPMASVTGQVDIALSDVHVNGVPLDVGPRCHTSTPVQLNLSGIPPYNPLLGGPLEGVLNIPPFTGCGVTENLDPLLNAPLSGPNNLVRIIQGAPGLGGPPVPPVFQ
jgi:uncharacterized protein DUF6801